MVLRETAVKSSGFHSSCSLHKDTDTGQCTQDLQIPLE